MSKNPCIPIFLICLLSLLVVAGCGGPEEPPKTPAPIAKKMIPKPNAAPGKDAPAMPAPGQQAAAPGEAGTADKPESTSPALEGAETANAETAQSSDDSIALELYNPAGKIDPFAPLFKEEQIVTPDEGPVKKRQRRAHLTPLEKVDLSQLTLLGTILAPSGNRAMVADTDGKGYVVTQGTYIGMSSGRVMEILRDRIVVEEEVENILGKLSLRKRELKLQKPPGE